MSTLVPLILIALAAQTAADSRYSSIGQYPIDPIQPAASDGAAAGQPIDAASSANSVTAPPPQGPPGQVDSTYATGGNGTGLGSSFAPVNNSLGQSFPPAEAQPLSPAGARAIDSGFNSASPLSATRTASAPAAGQVQVETALGPAAMMRAMLATPSNSRLPGEQVTLDEVVIGATSRGDQSERIEAYWDLCSSIADYFLGLREQEELRRLRQRFPQAIAALEQAEQQLDVRVGTAERAARASQLRLASLTGRGTDRLPQPAHPPHCGNYQTRHEQVFANRYSAEADELTLLISLRHAELNDACTAVNRTDAWLRNVAASSSGTDETSLLRALELLALERRAFVQIARDYNRRIARYVELAAPGQVAADQLIGMLIKRNSTSTATLPSSTNPPADRRSQNGTDGPSTYAGGASGWTPVEPADFSTARRDEAITPASNEATPPVGGERSLIVPPR